VQLLHVVGIPATPRTRLSVLARPVIAAVFFLEKNWRYGVLLSRVSGAVCVIIGVAVMAKPDFLQLLFGPMA
jgi:predicted metal-binding membrane protein